MGQISELAVPCLRADMLANGKMGARFQVTAPAPRGSWDRVAREDPDTFLTQTPGWLDFMASRLGGEDGSLLYEFETGEEAVLPLLRARKWPGLWSLQSFPFGWGYGGVVGRAPAGAQTAIWADLLRRHPWNLRVHPSPERAGFWAGALQSAPRLTAYRAQVLDLAPGFASLWKDQFRHQTRSSVRRAERSGLEIGSGTGPAQVQMFSDLYKHSVDRWAARRGQPLLAARVLARWRDRMGQLAGASALEGCRLWTACVRETPVAALVVLSYGGTAFAWLSAMHAELARETRAGHLLHTLAIEHACSQGALRYHFGESDPGSSVEEFKLRFGARSVDYKALLHQRIPTAGAAEHLKSGVTAVLACRPRAS